MAGNTLHFVCIQIRFKPCLLFIVKKYISLLWKIRKDQKNEIKHYPWSYDSKTINVSPVYICIHFIIHNHRFLLLILLKKKTLLFTLTCIYKKDWCWKDTGRTDAEAEAPVFQSSDVNKRLIGKVPDAGKYRGQKKKRLSEDEMAGWHRCMQSTWTWANPGRRWGTGRPDMLKSMGSQRVGQAWLTEQQQYIHIAVSTLFPQLDRELLIGRKQGFISFTNFCKHSTLNSLWGTWLMRRIDLSVQFSQQVWVLTTKESVHY